MVDGAAGARLATVVAYQTANGGSTIAQVPSTMSSLVQPRDEGLAEMGVARPLAQQRLQRLGVAGDQLVFGAGADEIVVIGRRGGPEILDSEVARLAHLSGLSLTIAAGAE